MLELERIREKIIALSESDAKSILMLTAANLQMVEENKGEFKCEGLC